MSPSAVEAPRYQRSQFFAGQGWPVYAATTSHVGDLEAHSHDFLETAVVLNGSAEHLTVAGSRSLRRGSAIVVRPGSWHGYARCQDFVITNCCFLPELFSRELSWLRNDQAVNRLVWSAPAARGRHGVYVSELSAPSLAACEQSLARLAQSLEGDPESRAVVLGSLAVFLGHLSQMATGESATGLGTTPVIVVSAVAILNDESTMPWRVEDLAARVHVGPAHLTRLFTRFVGTPPMAYLSRVRAERAASLLTDTNRLVADVAAEVGWPDPSYFARAFRTHYGMSPRAYRAQLAPASNAADHGALPGSWGSLGSRP